MYDQLDLFRISSAMAVHAGQRQAVIAQNVAHADTPGYVARDIAQFATLYEGERAQLAPRATRLGHLNGVQAGSTKAEPFKVNHEASPDGNAVSLETEMLRSVDAKRQHDRALAIYRSSLNVLRTALGK